MDNVAGRLADKVIDAAGSIFSRLLTSPEFVITFANTRAIVTEGSVRSGFASGCSEIARTFELPEGTISGYETDGSIRLEFSSEIPPQAQQRLRNLFGSY